MVRTLSQEAADTKPTAFHHMLARMAQDNRLARLYTQNIDCIETSLQPLITQVPLPPKAPWPTCIQLHGSLDKMVCQKCRHLAQFDRDLFDGPEAPACPACTETDELRTTTGQRSHGVGKMRPRIVLYNEHNPDEEAIAAVMNSDIRSRPDTVIVVGTSLKIPGVRRLVKSLCKVVRAKPKGIAMWINNEPPVGKEFEDCWDLVVKGNCEEVARLAGLKQWNDNTPQIFDECNDLDVERVKREQSVSVVVNTPKKVRKTDAGVLTPVSNNDESGDELPHKNSKQPLANPASRGRTVMEALIASKSNNKKKPAPKQQVPKKLVASAPKKKGPTKEQSAKITNYSMVTKGNKGSKVGKGGKAMKPLPANSILFPGLVDPKGQETISPESIPKDMEALIS